MLMRIPINLYVCTYMLHKYILSVIEGFSVFQDCLKAMFLDFLILSFLFFFFSAVTVLGWDPGQAVSQPSKCSLLSHALALLSTCLETRSF